jgi:CheY-like chemotaxis protein
MALEDHGHEVIAVGTLGEAFEHLCMGLPFSFLVTDVQIPGAIDGKMFANVAADLRPGLPILVVSGYPEPQGGELPPRARFLKKPFTADYLLGQVAGLLPESRSAGS